MDENFSKFVALHIGIFHFFCSNVFTLLQFEYVLFAVDNAESASFGTHCTHIASLEPSVLSNRFLCLSLVVVISQKYSVSSRPNFTTRSRVTLFVLVGGKIVHFGNIHKFQLKAGLNRKFITIGPPTCLTSGSSLSLIVIAQVVSV